MFNSANTPFNKASPKGNLIFQALIFRGKPAVSSGQGIYSKKALDPHSTRDFKPPSSLHLFNIILAKKIISNMASIQKKSWPVSITPKRVKSSRALFMNQKKSRSAAIDLDLHVRCLEQVNNIITILSQNGGGLMVIYQWSKVKKKHFSPNPKIRVGVYQKTMKIFGSFAWHGIDIEVVSCLQVIIQCWSRGGRSHRTGA